MGIQCVLTALVTLNCLFHRHLTNSRKVTKCKAKRSITLPKIDSQDYSLHEWTSFFIYRSFPRSVMNIRTKSYFIDASRNLGIWSIYLQPRQQYSPPLRFTSSDPKAQVENPWDILASFLPPKMWNFVQLYHSAMFCPGSPEYRY